jgi:hypothetical protein
VANFIRSSGNKGRIFALPQRPENITMLLRLTCLAALAVSCFAQLRSITIAHVDDMPRRHTSRLWTASCLALIAATSADMASSWGRNEANAMLRSGDGRFGPKGMSIKLAMAGGMIAPQYFVMKRAPGSQRLFTIANFLQAGLYTGVAVRNYRVQDGPPLK